MKTGFDFEENEKGEDLISEINITPLVDVMLLLMIIFLVTAPLLVNNLNVDIPKAEGASQSENISKMISVSAIGNIYFENQLVSLDQLDFELKNLAKLSAEISIKIAADKNARYQDIASILSILSKNSISSISFLSKS